MSGDFRSRPGGARPPPLPKFGHEVSVNAESQSRPIAFFDMKAQQALIRGAIDAGIARVLDHGRFIQGPEVDELERRLAEFAGVAHAVGVSSGTDALQIALMAEGIGPGDAVFLPAFTYTATAEVALVLGATPVFVDVEEASFNLDMADLARRLALVEREGRLRPRAVIGVDLYGRPADWPAILRLCESRGMFALDDAAQAFGGALHDKRLGAWGQATALSFYPTKTLGCYGDGGALLTDDAGKAELYRSLRTHGEGKTRYEVMRTGMNARLDSIQAAILLPKLGLLEQELAAREKVAGWYAARLGGRVQPGQQRFHVGIGHGRAAGGRLAGRAPQVGEDAAALVRLGAGVVFDHQAQAVARVAVLVQVQPHRLGRALDRGGANVARIDDAVVQRRCRHVDAVVRGIHLLVAQA